MELNEKMIDDMMEQMSSQEKEEMMRKLMEKFFSEMSRGKKCQAKFFITDSDRE
jgi:hypothetical protein